MLRAGLFADSDLRMQRRYRNEDPPVNTVRKRLMMVLTVLCGAFLATLFALQSVQSRTASLILASSSRDKADTVRELFAIHSTNVVSAAEDYAGDGAEFEHEMYAVRTGASINAFKMQRRDVDELWLLGPDGQTQMAIAPRMGTSPPMISFTPTQLSRLTAPRSSTTFVQVGRDMVEVAVRALEKETAGGSVVTGYVAAGHVWDGAYLSHIARSTGCGVKVVSTRRAAAHPRGMFDLQTLLGPDGAPVAELYLTGDTSVAELISNSQVSTIALFVVFAGGLLAILFMGLVAWVNRPLDSISRALVGHDPNDLATLARDRSEFGRLATLVRDFFAQKDLLVAEIGERTRAEEELRRIRDELEHRVDERTAELLSANEAMREEVAERLRTENALRAAELKYRSIVENAVEGIFQTTPDGRLLEANPAFARILGHDSVEEMLDSFETPGHLPYVHAERQDQFSRVIEQLDTVHDFEVQMYRKDGGAAWLSINARVVRDDAGNTMYYEGTIEDVSERKRSESEIIRLNASLEDRISRIVALRRIDIAISASHDLSATLQIFLSEVTEQLGVNAAAVLLCDQKTLRLKYAGSKGFRTNALRHTHLSLGAGQAGKAALERRKIHIGDLTLVPEVFGQSPAFREEGFVTYIAVPLLAKGQVMGVLEVFHRSQIETNHEWLDFLEALAGQAAIAIDNAVLFEGLQRSNEELTLAYDATIEGWSRVLDLRDKETEGHSQRVTEMAMRLGRKLGLSESDLVHVRRGALLHDIGKMGIPDGILLKPASLTEDEWRIMRMHPVYAYEMLYPIEFLRPALDIPYGHHEKWDGTGYPRGLKGEQIPIAARIFALVDVWDALRSDRPYRKSWTEEQVIEHVQSLAGKHFDPAVVVAFVNMIQEQRHGRPSELLYLPKAA